MSRTGVNGMSINSRLQRMERDLQSHLAVFVQQVEHDAKAFDKLEQDVKNLSQTVNSRFDNLEQLITDFRLHEARREGGEDAVKRLAGYISGIVAAAVSALGVLLQRLFLE